MVGIFPPLNIPPRIGCWKRRMTRKPKRRSRWPPGGRPPLLFLLPFLLPLPLLLHLCAPFCSLLFLQSLTAAAARKCWKFCIPRRWTCHARPRCLGWKRYPRTPRSRPPTMAPTKCPWMFHPRPLRSVRRAPSTKATAVGTSGQCCRPPLWRWAYWSRPTTDRRTLPIPRPHRWLPMNDRHRRLSWTTANRWWIRRRHSIGENTEATTIASGIDRSRACSSLAVKPAIPWATCHRGRTKASAMGVYRTARGNGSAGDGAMRLRPSSKYRNHHCRWSSSSMEVSLYRSMSGDLWIATRTTHVKKKNKPKRETFRVKVKGKGRSRACVWEGGAGRIYICENERSRQIVGMICFFFLVLVVIKAKKMEIACAHDRLFFRLWRLCNSFEVERLPRIVV